MEKNVKIPQNYLQRAIFSFIKPSDQLRIALVSKTYLKVFCSLYSIDPSQFAFFLHYLNLFSELKKLDPHPSYCNCPHEIDLHRVPSSTGVSKSTVHMAVAFLLNSSPLPLNSPKESRRYLVNISSEEELKAQINIMKHLQHPDAYSYHIRGQECDLTIESLFELSQLLRRYSPLNYFDKVTEHCLNGHIAHDLCFVDLDKIAIDKAIAYSLKFPNKIQRLQCNNENEDKDKLKQLATLNSISLVQVPNPFFELYTACKNIKHVSFMSNETISVPADFDCSKVEIIDTVGFNDESIDHLTEVIGKFPNLKQLMFSTWFSFQHDSFMSFFKRVNAPNVTRLQFSAQYLEEDTTFDFFLERFPKLERFEVEEHESMDFSYRVSPVFCCEKTQMSMESLEKLIRNYLFKEHRTLSLTLSNKSEEQVLEYFAPKKDIMNRVKQVYFYGESSKVIERVKTLTINSDEIRGDYKHVDRLVVEVEVDEKVIAFAKKVTPVLLDINVEDDDLEKYAFVKEIPSLRFVLFKRALKFVKKNNQFVKLD